ncbi:hypothetical protein QBC45DRAFT_191956 [Copromyces sp. CBS 386.78]|nr:hypothetical protein QBC45DRAFT_191956 [Copromyces sp. CBS 386.78]
MLALVSSLCHLCLVHRPAPRTAVSTPAATSLCQVQLAPVYQIGRNSSVLRPATSHCIFPYLDSSSVQVALLQAASLGLVIISQLEHRRYVKPSSLILLYLLTSGLCDSVQLTIPSLRYLDRRDERAITGWQLAVKAVVLYIECLSKENVLNEEDHTDSLEERASVLSRAFVSWIGPVVKEGYSMVLVNERLPSVDRELKSGSLRASILRTLSQNCES